MNKLVGRPIAKPEKLAVHERPQFDEEPRQLDISRLVTSRAELKQAIDDLQDSPEVNESEGLAALADAEEGFAELDALLPNSMKARNALIEHLDWIDHEGLKGPERLQAMAHAFSTNIDDLDPDTDSDLIAAGQQLFAIINPVFKEIE